MESIQQPDWHPGVPLSLLTEGPGFLAGSWTCATPGSWGKKQANHFELWLQRSGSRQMRVDGHEITADPLTAVFHNPGEELGSRALDPHQDSTVILLNESLIEQLLGSALMPKNHKFAVGTLPLNSSATMQHFLIRRIAESGCEQEVTAEAVLGLLSGLEKRLGQVVDAQERTAGVPGNRHHRRLAFAARELIATRFRDRILLHDMADTLGTSVFHLCRVFKAESGMSLHRYQARLRLQSALDRLRDPGADLTQVALEQGFSSHSHFSTAFRQEFGCAPRQARSGILPR